MHFTNYLAALGVCVCFFGGEGAFISAFGNLMKTVTLFPRKIDKPTHILLHCLKRIRPIHA